MSQKPEVIKEFPVCPWCGSNETGSELAIQHLGLREKGLVKDTDFVSSSKIMFPLYNPALAVLTIPFGLQEIDSCGGCGRNRTIRVSVLEVPMSVAKGLLAQLGMGQG